MDVCVYTSHSIIYTVTAIATTDGRTHFHVAALVKESDRDFENMVILIHRSLQKWYG